MSKSRIILTSLVLSLVLLLSRGPIVAGNSSEPGKIVTLYQNGPSLVVDQLEPSLDKGLNGLTIPVPKSIIARTVFTTVPEASFRSSRLVPAVESERDLLESLVGTDVTVSSSGSFDTRFEGVLVGVVGGKPLFETSDGEMRLVRSPEEYRFKGFSPEKRDTRLELELAAEEEVDAKLTLGYQLSKLNWAPQYVGFLDEERGSLDLKGVANIVNGTGWNFRGVQLKLLAGQPNRKERRVNYYAEARSSNQQETSSPEEVFEYYRYSVGFPVDLASGVETQVEFLHQDPVSYQKYYLFEPYSSTAVRTILELSNREDEGLGLPLASGTVRIYRDTDQRTFLGEDSLPNFPVGEEAKLELGDAFDVKGERKRTSHEKLGERRWKDQVEITIENRKNKSVKLRVKDKLNGDWEIIRSSHDYEKIDSRIIRYDESVPSEGTVEISYIVQYEL